MSLTAATVPPKRTYAAAVSQPSPAVPGVPPALPATKKRKHSSRLQSRVETRDDALGKLIQKHTRLFCNVGFDATVRSLRPRGDLVKNQSHWHPASPLLSHFAKSGVPALLRTPPWSPELIEERVKRGCHKSTEEHLDFLREEMLEFVEKGFWILLPYRLVKYMRQLRVSPLGVIPQRGRRPRLIVDYSFYGINQETVNLAPKEAMQFGRALERILYHIRHANPKYGPVYLSKVDLSDGFYRVGLN